MLRPEVTDGGEEPLTSGDNPWPSQQPVLTDVVVVLRGFRPEDAAEVYRACQDLEIQHFTQVPVPYLPEHAAGWVSANAALWAEARTANFAVTDQGTSGFLGVVGIIGADHALGQAGVGYWTAPCGRGRGITTRAVRLATDWALTEGGLQRLRAEVEQTNPASTRVIESAGFSRADMPVVQEELKGSLRTFVVWEKRAQSKATTQV
jgi:RimJ/RimL family protein N-acetyltransferase